MREFCFKHQVLREAGQPCPRCATDDRLVFDARLSDLTNDQGALRERVAGLERRLREAERLILRLLEQTATKGTL